MGFLLFLLDAAWLLHELEEAAEDTTMNKCVRDVIFWRVSFFKVIYQGVFLVYIIYDFQLDLNI